MNKFLSNAATAGVVGVVGGLALRTLLRQTRKYSFQNRVVAITGGSRGLGLVIARQFAHEGARIAICARDADELSRAEAELRRNGVQVFGKVCDVANKNEIQAFFHDVESVLGPVDVLVNNAGVISVGPIETMTDADYQQSLATHFWGPLYAIESVLPEMKRRRSGRIVNIASIGGKIAVPHLVPYCAGKFALVGLSSGLRTELLKDGVLVTTVCPGLMRTGSPRQALFNGQHRLEYTWFSISDSLPLLTVSAEHAARKIVKACRVGQAELVVSVPAKIAVQLNALAPELFSEVLGLVHQLLPGPGGVGQETRKGSESKSFLSPSWVTTLTEQAAVRNNEISPAKA